VEVPAGVVGYEFEVEVASFDGVGDCGFALLVLGFALGLVDGRVV
jgi:hypothetical protein